MVGGNNLPSPFPLSPFSFLLCFASIYRSEEEEGKGRAIELGNDRENTKTGRLLQQPSLPLFPFVVFLDSFSDVRSRGMDFPSRILLSSAPFSFLPPSYQIPLPIFFSSPSFLPKGFFGRRCSPYPIPPHAPAAVNHAERFDEFSGATFGRWRRDLSPLLLPLSRLSSPSLMYANLCKEIRNGTVN